MTRDNRHRPGCPCDDCDPMHRRALVLRADRRRFRLNLKAVLKPALRRALRVDRAEADRLANDIAAQTGAYLVVKP